MSINDHPSPQAEHVSADTLSPIPISQDSIMSANAPNCPKPKGRKRFLHSLQRMSSSQSLLRLHRTSSSGYRSTGKGSISCISLSSSASCSNALGSSYGSQLSQGFSTAPTSVLSTPCEPPISEDLRFRYMGEGRSSAARTPLSVPVPQELQSNRPVTSAGSQIMEEDYFSCQPLPEALLETPSKEPLPRRLNFDFWNELPSELKTSIFSLLEPREIVRCSRVSRAWHTMCFDGQLWTTLDASLFYQKIPATTLMDIISKAGPFARNLNLRGCAQLIGETHAGQTMADICSNLEILSLQDCHLPRAIVHNLLYQNSRLVSLNLSGLRDTVSNTTLKIVAQQCGRLEHLDVSWCSNIDTRGLCHIVRSCSNLRDLRAGEVKDMRNVGFMVELFEKNAIERLILTNCQSLTPDAFTALFEGIEPEKDYLTGRAIVPPRKLKHLDIARCAKIDDQALLSMVGNAPELEGLQLAKCSQITDLSLTQLLPTAPRLTHLDLEELDQLTNATLQELAKAPCKTTIQHLSISYCENLGDVGMIPVLKECKSLRTVELDNTRISDLVLIEAASAVRTRPSVTNAVRPDGQAMPEVGLSMVVYDCQNVTWTGIREILSRNAEPRNPRGYPVPAQPYNMFVEAEASTLALGHVSAASRAATPAVVIRARVPPPPTVHTYPSQIISLKVFYGYQPTVTEHTKRCLRGDFAAAARLERKWAEYMVASEEAGAPGGFGPGGFGLFTGVAGRRRRRRIREAAMMHADEEDEGALGSGVGRRRRARSGGSCAVM